MELGDRLAAVNACLNAVATVFLVGGWIAIRRGARVAHRRAMLTAFGVSCAFLASYLVRVAIAETHAYPDDAPFRTLYLTVLAVHVPLAALVPFLAVATIALAWTGRLGAHRRLARVALPVWLTVSVTGVAVYLMLYPLAGAGRVPRGTPAVDRASGGPP